MENPLILAMLVPHSPDIRAMHSYMGHRNLMNNKE